MLAAVAGLVAGSCGGSTGDSGGSAPCDDELSGQCGKSCTLDSECGVGLHCGGKGECTAECVDGGGDCKSGERCDATGRCVDGGGLIPNLDGGTGGFPSGDACVAFNVGFEKQIPTVVLLIDQSGSMREDFGGKPRWDAVRDALMDTSTGLVRQLQDDIRFGLALYTSQNGNEGGECPMLTEVAIQLGNYSAINAAMQAAGPEDETPTGESLALITPDLAAYPEPGDKVVVLATDGEPDTCAEPNPQNGQPEAVQAVENAFDEGIRTYVISVGSGVSDTHLQDLANAGLGRPLDGSNDAPFYVADDQDRLADAFREIVNGVRSCVFDLAGSVKMEEWGSGVIVLDGDTLEYQTDWRMRSGTELELLGEACETIKDGSHNLDVQFPCGSVQPVPQ